MPTILVHPAGFGARTVLDAESMMRVRKAFSVYQSMRNKGIKPGEIYFVSSVQDRLPEGGQSQSEAIKETLVGWGIVLEQVVTSNQSSTTLDDVRNCYSLIRNYQLPQPIVNVSSWYHIPRIWLIWKTMRKRTGRLKLKFAFAGSRKHRFVFQEPLKILRLLRKWRKGEI